MNFVTTQLGIPDEITKELARLSATYEILKISEKGQNGYLFIARNKIIDRKVVLKFYFWADGVRAHVEPKTLGLVQSDGVIEILDASLIGEEWALFVTPFCKNGDLDRYLETNRFELRHALRFTVALLNGVSALHEHSFVHRDLKPENILVSDAAFPLIADFGSVRIIPEGSNDVPGSGHAVLYRPPESFITGRYDRRGDVYQCGIVLFQVLGGKLSYSPLAHLSAQEREQYAEMVDNYEKSKFVDSAIEKKVCNGYLLNFKSLPSHLPNNVRTLLKKSLQINPTKRYQCASEFMNALNNAIGSAPDWRFSNGEYVAFTDKAKFRLISGNTKGLYVIQKNQGGGWRKLPGTGEASWAKQLRHLSKIIGQNIGDVVSEIE